jgi:hypothetical protein
VVTNPLLRHSLTFFHQHDLDPENILSRRFVTIFVRMAMTAAGPVAHTVYGYVRPSNVSQRGSLAKSVRASKEWP